jgi:hypothetical protein
VASAKKRRNPLTSGIFPELEIRAKAIEWTGKADLLVLSPTKCEITDFKSGRPCESHKFQVQVYAVLWSRDEELNPTGRVVDRLILSYEGGDIEVEPPNASQLVHLEKELVHKRMKAQACVSTHPPEARVKIGNCRCCGVRQLCDNYWTSDAQMKLAGDADQRFRDLELRIVTRHGSLSWDAVIELSGVAQPGKAALLRVPHPVDFKPGARVRVLDAGVAVDPEFEEQPIIVTQGVFSELFVVE